jgi:hypothetical protein
MRQLLSVCAAVLTALLVLPSTASADGFASCKWHVVTSPNPLSDQNYLGFVSATSKNNAWAFGNATGAATATLAEFWDGHAWSISPSLNPSGGLFDSFNGGVAIAPGDVWAVGATYNGNTGLYQTLAEHWNGSAWTVVPTPNVSGVNNQFYAVAADGTNDVWAVGIYRVAPGIRGNLVAHWNGSAWSIVPSPNKGTGDNALGSVIAFAPNVAFADGGYNSPNAKTLIERWNGTKWSIAKSKNANTNSNIFNMITGVGPTDVWALGDYSTGSIFNSLAEHWNGTNWQLVPSANMGTDFTAIFGGTAVTAHDVWGVGLWSDGSNNFPYTMNWNGSTWSSVNTPAIGASGGIFTGAAAIPGTSDVWAVGATDNANATPHLTLIEKFHC